MVKDSLQRVYTEGEIGDLEDENGVGESESSDEGSGELSTYRGTVSESTFSEETQGNQLANMLEELVQAGEEDEPNAEPKEENLKNLLEKIKGKAHGLVDKKELEEEALRKLNKMTKHIATNTEVIRNINRLKIEEEETKITRKSVPNQSFHSSHSSTWDTIWQNNFKHKLP